MYCAPTDTNTSTITPTTLKFIEDFSMDFSGGPIEHKNQACFMTPQLSSYNQLNEINQINNTKNNLINQLNNQTSVQNQFNFNMKQIKNSSLNNFSISNTNFNNELTGFNYNESSSNIKLENNNSESDLSDLRYVNSKYPNLNNNLLNLANPNNFNFTNMQFKMDQNCNNLNEIGNLTTKSKRGSGRKPTNIKEEKLTPEEEERRRIRRERNKEAAARCRKRRVDHTNNLIMETESLEEKKKLLTIELQKLKSEAEQLQILLKTHNCNFNPTNYNIS